MDRNLKSNHTDFDLKLNFHWIINISYKENILLKKLYKALIEMDLCQHDLLHRCDPLFHHGKKSLAKLPYIMSSYNKFQTII